MKSICRIVTDAQIMKMKLENLYCTDAVLRGNIIEFGKLKEGLVGKIPCDSGCAYRKTNEQK